MSDDIEYGRWYDKRPITAKAINMLEDLPARFQDIVAKGVYELTDKEFDTAEKMKSVRSLGKEKVLGLYMAKRRLRVMDEVPSFHTAVVHLYILNEDAQDFMAERIIEMMEFVRSYLKSCKEYEEEANQEDILGLTNTYVAKGGEEVEAFLHKIESLLLQKVRKRRQGTKRSTDPREAQLGYSARDGGMKIRGFDGTPEEPAAKAEPASKPEASPDPSIDKPSPQEPEDDLAEIQVDSFTAVAEPTETQEDT